MSGVQSAHRRPAQPLFFLLLGPCWVLLAPETLFRDFRGVIHHQTIPTSAVYVKSTEYIIQDKTIGAG